MTAAGSTPTMAEALEQHLRASGLPPDAGDSDAFAVVKLGPLPYPIPNTRACKRAVRIHDLNHLVSGYRTDREGELEISVWELASGGCGGYGAAWVSAWPACWAVCVYAPCELCAPSWRGRRQQNLYSYVPDDLLVMPFDQAEALTREAPSGTLARLPAPAHLALLILAVLPVAVALSLLWWVSYPGLLDRRFRRTVAPPTAERRRRVQGR